MVDLRQLTSEEAADQTLLPPELRQSGFPFLIPEWCWVVEFDSRPIALIVASFAHGMLVFWRILSTPDAKRVCRTWFRPSLLRILDNARLRGCVGYLVLLEDHHPACRAIARIIQRKNGVLIPFVGTLAAALLKE